MKYRTLSIFALTILISACSSRPTGPTTPPPESVTAIKKWETAGRVGIRTKEDAVSGNFNWQKDPQTFDLSIVGPFGQGATNLKQDAEGKVTLAYEDKVITGNDPASLLQQELGWEFPVNQVTYWIRGLAAPTSIAKVTKDPESQLPKKIEQDGWIISYSKFTDVDGLSLPQKMQVSNPPFRVNLIINEWAVQ